MARKHNENYGVLYILIRRMTCLYIYMSACKSSVRMYLVSSGRYRKMPLPCYYCSCLPVGVHHLAADHWQAAVLAGADTGPVLGPRTNQVLGVEPGCQRYRYLHVRYVPGCEYLLQRHHGLHYILHLRHHAKHVALDKVQACKFFLFFF